MSKFQYKISTKWWCYYWLGLNLLKPNIHTKDVSNQVSSYSDLESKSYFVQITVPKWEKTKKWEKMFWITKRGNKRITNQGRFWGLQIGARGITIGASLGISNRGKKITSRGRDYKSGQGLQIGAEQ